MPAPMVPREFTARILLCNSLEQGVGHNLANSLAEIFWEESLAGGSYGQHWAAQR